MYEMSLWHRPAAQISTITSRGPGARTERPSTSWVLVPSKTMPRIRDPVLLQVIDVQHPDRVAAQKLVHDLVGQVAHLLFSDLGCVGPGAVAVRIIALVCDVVLADRIEGRETVAIVEEAPVHMLAED